MKVKNITQIIPKVGILAVGLLVATSCNDITELQPADAFSESTAFSSAQRVELAIIGMYNAAQSGTYAGGAVRGYPFGSASIEQGDMRGEDMLNQALFYQITYESSYTPFSANNVWMWNTLYTLINQCNVVIEGVKLLLLLKSLPMLKQWLTKANADLCVPWLTMNCWLILPAHLPKKVVRN